MTFLSRLELVSDSVSVIRDLGDVDRLHKLVMRAFPTTDRPEARATFGVLFRAEPGPVPRLLVQSHIPPRWEDLPEGVVRHVASKPVDDAFDAIAEGAFLQFLLVANPSKKVARDAPNSARVELRGDDERHAWLAARGERAGFALHGSGPHDGVRIDPLAASPRSRIVVRAVRYEGRLVVRDARLFRATLETGIGPAKAYGCGLLSVRPG